MTGPAGPDSGRGPPRMPAVLRLMLAVVVCGLAVAIGRSGPAQAQNNPPAAVPGNDLRLVSQTSWVADGDVFRVQVAVTTPDPAAAHLQMTVFGPVLTRADFTSSLSDRMRTPKLKVFEPVAVAAADQPTTVSFALNPKSATTTKGAQTLAVTAAGIYPIRVDLVDAQANLLDRLDTHMVYGGNQKTAISRLDVALVVPVHALPIATGSPGPAGSTSVPTAAPGSTGAQSGSAVTSTTEPIATTSPGASAGPSAGLPAAVAQPFADLTASLAAHPRVPLTMAPTPQTIETMGGGPAPQKAIVSQLAQVLSDSSYQLVGSTYVRLDLPSLLGAGLESELSAQLALGASVTAANLHATPDPGVWIETGSLSSAAVDDLAGRGVRRLVIRDDTLAPLPPDQVKFTPTQTFAVGTSGRQMAAVSSDAALAAHFDSQPDPVLGAHQLLADLALIQEELPQKRGRGVAILPPDDWRPDASFVTTVLEGMGSSPMLSPVTVDKLFSDVVPFQQRQATLVRGIAVPQPHPTPISSSASIRATRRTVTSLSQLLPSGAPILDQVERALLASESADVADRLRPAVLEVANRLIEQVKGMVKLPGNRSITFTARQGRIPITVLSSASFPVRVSVKVSSQKLDFDPVGVPGAECAKSGTAEVCTLVLRNQDTTLQVPIVARTAGVFSLAVSLESPDGSLILASNVDTVRSAAASGVGVILSVGAILLLAVWWARDVRHGRRAKRLVPAAAAAGVGAPDALFVADGAGAAHHRSGDLGAHHHTHPDGAARSDPPPPDSGSRPTVPSVPPGSDAGGRHFRQAPTRDESVLEERSPLITAPVRVVPDDHRSGPSVPGARVEIRATPDQPPGSFSRHTKIMAAGTLLSRLTGFGRVLALVWAFHLTGLADVYNIANTVPNILYDLVLGGVLSATLVPVFVECLNRDDPDEGWRAISAVVTAITVTLVALSAVFWLAAPAIIHLYLSLNHAPTVADQAAVGTSLLRLFVPQLFLLGGIAVTTALLNARRRFAAAAFSPVINNLIVIAAIVATRLIASDLGLTGFRHQRAAMLVLGLGTTAGYLLQFLVQLPSLVRGRFRLRPVLDLSHPAVRTVLRLSLWTFGSVMANQIAFNLVLVLAERKTGDVTVFQTAYQFFQLPYAIFAVSIASVLTPELSDHWAKGELIAFRRQMASGLRLTLAILVPAAVGYVVLAHPFLELVFHHGSFSVADAQRIGNVVALFAIGLPGFSAYLLLMRGYQAMQDTRSMFWLYVVENLATVALAGALYPVMGVGGLALGWGGAYTVGSIVALAHLRRRTGGLEGHALVSGLVRVAAATAAMALPVLALTHLLNGRSQLALAAEVGGGAIVGAAVYLAACRALGITEVSAILRRNPAGVPA